MYCVSLRSIACGFQCLSLLCAPTRRLFACRCCLFFFIFLTAAFPSLCRALYVCWFLWLQLLIPLDAEQSRHGVAGCRALSHRECGCSCKVPRCSSSLCAVHCRLPHCAAARRFRGHVTERDRGLEEEKRHDQLTRWAQVDSPAEERAEKRDAPPKR